MVVLNNFLGQYEQVEFCIYSSFLYALIEFFSKKATCLLRTRWKHALLNS